MRLREVMELVTEETDVELEFSATESLVARATFRMDDKTIVREVLDRFGDSAVYSMRTVEKKLKISIE